MATLTPSAAQQRRLAEALRGYDLVKAVAHVMRMLGENGEVRETGCITDGALDAQSSGTKTRKRTSGLKRPPRPGEPALTHITWETGNGETFALAPGNYNPETLATLEPSLPKAPGPPGWEVVFEKPAGEYARFQVIAGSKPVTRNRVKTFGHSLELTTSFLPGAGRLTVDALRRLTRLEECIAIVLCRPLGSHLRFRQRRRHAQPPGPGLPIQISSVKTVASSIVHSPPL